MPASALPQITTPVIINGFSQPGSSANNMPNQGLGAGVNAVQTIVLDGNAISPQVDGLAISAGDSAIQGLVIQNFGADIHLTTNGNDQIAGNSLADTGLQFHGGLFIDNVANNIVGGTTNAARNVIAFVGIEGTAASSNIVDGNYIGTDGIQALGGLRGLDITDASNNVVGGTAPGAGNVIASHGQGVGGGNLH
jgi:hypothetical protein